MVSFRSIYQVMIPLFLLVFFALGLSHEQLDFRFYSLAITFFAVGIIIFTPINWALVALFIFIGFQGFFKVISNYHPIVHLGADILVITMVTKLLVQYLIGQWKGPETRIPFSVLFIFHFSWLAIVAFNPYALSVAASIAGAKIYVSMLLLYFFGFLFTRSLKDVHKYMWALVFVAVIQIIFTIYQGFIGPISVTSIHPRYAIQLQKYLDTAFRPFGLTHLPGGPSVYICYTIPFMFYFFFQARSFILKSFLAAVVPLSAMAFLLCQVRSAMVKAIIGGTIYLVGSLFQRKNTTSRDVFNIISMATVMVVGLAYIVPSLMDASIESNQDNQRAFARTLTSFELDRYATARDGSWDRFVQYASAVPLGAGFARVGAAAGAFKNLNHADPHFKQGYFFSDNFWIASLIEIGLPGMFIMTLLVFGIFFKGLRQWYQGVQPETKNLQLAILGALLALIIGLYGSEGVLYNPDSSFFWFFAGVLMRLQHLDDNLPTIA